MVFTRRYSGRRISRRTSVEYAQVMETEKDECKLIKQGEWKKESIMH